MDNVVLALSDTRANRSTVRTYGATLAGAFPLMGRTALELLQRGRPFPSNVLVLV